ncbi:McrB family protein [Salinicoccus cyprini]|nr:AAA family ATPase [Salinicoccus cyprini]
MSNYKDRKFFFVGTTIEGTDYTNDFMDSNEWRLGWEGKEDDEQYQLMRLYYDQMSEGDYIVLKSTYTRKNNLPFSNPNNKSASVMRIKAVGVITQNPGDGHTIKVAWINDYRTRMKEWYFYTSRVAMWMLDYEGDFSSRLVEFALNDNEQDYSFFLSDDYWKKQFYNEKQFQEYELSQQEKKNEVQFDWVDFYKEFADKLRPYSNDRSALIEKVKNTYNAIGMELPKLESDRNVIDIDPFTIFALFNKGITDENRIKIIKGLKEEFSVNAAVPETFDGIPVVNNMAATFYYFIGDREEHDIDNLWAIFNAALDYEQLYSEESRKDFIENFNTVILQRGIKWNLTMGLYWIRPEAFINLDAKNRAFISTDKNMTSEFVDQFGVINKMPGGEAYLDIIEAAHASLESRDFKYSTFPELSFHAWHSTNRMDETNSSLEEMIEVRLEDAELSEYASKLVSSKNVILRGAPGTGKTYLARNIAAEVASGGRIRSFDDLDEQYQDNTQFIQFHPSYDYTDFVEGFRPTIDDETNEMRYEIVPGIFKKFVSRAIAAQSEGGAFVFIIDEINRGEISKIFGELFFAIDPGYRGHLGAVKTQYASIDDESDVFYVPENVYIVGTMNDIDRSVESFDFAMRRRFRFIEVTAESQIGMLKSSVDDYEDAVNHMLRLNNAISEVEGLNSHYHIGPSYFLKLSDIDNNYELLWQDYLEPLLEEYVRGFFDEVTILSDLKAAYDGKHREYEDEN